MDMDLFTCFPHEEEHLIFETRLHIQNIFMPQNTLWVGDKLMKKLSLFDLLIHGNNIHDEKLLTKKNQKSLTKLLQRILKGEICNYTDSPYVNQLIESLTTQNDKIWLNTNQINALTHEELKKMFVSETNDDFGKFILYLKEQVKISVCPIFLTSWKMNDATFNLVSRSADIKYKRDVVIQGPTVKCNVFENRKVVFQPQLTRNENRFHLQMKLISVQKNNKSKGNLENEIALSEETKDNKTHIQKLNQDQVKVHFDVSCKEANNYYTSLHPRIMDKRWNNTFNITLPSMENVDPQSKESISITTCIMIHNVEEFGMNQEILPTNMMETADMTTASHSYTVPDILSIIYGVSNSIISILDSMSDIFFVAFLLSFDDLHQSGNKEAEKITNFLFVLCVGNLVSIAIIIAYYTTEEAIIESFWKKNLVRLAFFILSPCLPAFEWLLQKYKSSSVNALILSPECDGVLLWFEQELMRNRIFLIETVFES
eukprot:520731_1